MDGLDGEQGSRTGTPLLLLHHSVALDTTDHDIPMDWLYRMAIEDPNRAVF